MQKFKKHVNNIDNYQNTSNIFIKTQYGADSQTGFIEKQVERLTGDVEIFDFTGTNIERILLWKEKEKLSRL